MKYLGGYHCGNIEFEVEAPEQLVVFDCNCSICSQSGFLHYIVPKSKFRLLKGEQELSCYQFGTGVAQHLFCRTCGIKSFYIPRSNPDGIDVNVRCLSPQPKTIAITPFDGQNWEKEAGQLTHLSREIDT